MGARLKRAQGCGSQGAGMARLLPSHFPALFVWEHSALEPGTAGFCQNNRDLRWKDAGALGSTHISCKCLRNSYLFSGFLKSRQTWCLLLVGGFLGGCFVLFCFGVGFLLWGFFFSTRDRNCWLRTQGLNPQKKHVSRSSVTALATVSVFSYPALEVCKIQKGLQSVR